MATQIQYVSIFFLVATWFVTEKDLLTTSLSTGIFFYQYQSDLHLEKSKLQPTCKRKKRMAVATPLVSEKIQSQPFKKRIG
jgi:hypothetical protein